MAQADCDLGLLGGENMFEQPDIPSMDRGREAYGLAVQVLL